MGGYNTQLVYLMQPEQPMRILPLTIRLLLLLLASTMSAAPALADETDPAQTMFDEAMADRQTGKVFEAIKLFEDILKTNPYLNRARLELAVAYHQASRYQDALEQFKLVLDDPATPETVRLAILAYIGQLQSDQSRPEGSHNLSYYVKAGLIYNTNIGTVPGIGNIIVNGVNFLLPSDKIASVGTDIVLSASHSYRRKSPLNINGVATRFEWQSQVSVSSNLYEKTSDFNLNVISASTGPAFISTGHWLASVPVRLDEIYLGSSKLGAALSINPYITFDLGKYRSILLESSLLSRTYSDDVNAGQEGTLLMAGAGYTTLLKSLDSGLEAGFRLRNRDTDVQEFGYTGVTVYASGFTTLSEISSIYLKGNYRTFNYDAADTIFGGGTIVRDDVEASLNVGFNRDFKDGTLQKWTFNAELGYTDNNSNIDAYDYNRVIVTANLSRYIQ
jgi:tetratricopeptide (TPR) repeat protein